MTSFLTAWRSLDDARHRAELYRMWELGASAGFSVDHALDVMGPREDRRLEATRSWLVRGARRGASVAELARAPRAALSRFETALLVAGEETGSLPRSLALLAAFHERSYRLVLRVRKRLAAPLLTAIAASIIAPVPLLLAGHTGAYLVLVVAAGAGWTLAGGWFIRAAVARATRAPGLVRARFARTLATAIEAGLPLDRAIRLAADASDDPGVRAFVGRIDDRTLATTPPSVALAACPHMTHELRAVLANAERTGDYASTLTRLAELYEDGFR